MRPKSPALRRTVAAFRLVKAGAKKIIENKRRGRVKKRLEALRKNEPRRSTLSLLRTMGLSEKSTEDLLSKNYLHEQAKDYLRSYLEDHRKISGNIRDQLARQRLALGRNRKTARKGAPGADTGRKKR